MAQIAKVLDSTGKAFVVGVDGAVRVLEVGDVIERGESIRTEVGANVELLMADGQLLAVAPGHSVLVDDTLVQTDATPTAQEAALQADTPETVLQVLEQGADLTQTLEATAAGISGGDAGEGSSFVRLLRIAEGVEPLSYEFALGSPSTIEEVQLGAVPAAAEAIPGEVPANEVWSGSLAVEEEALRGGNPDNADGPNGPLAGVATGGVGWTGGVIESITVGNLPAMAVPAGGAVTVFLDQDGQPLGGNEPVGMRAVQLEVRSDGSYTLTLLGPLHHEPGQGENDFALPPVVLHGIADTGVQATVNLTLFVRDDVPLVTLDSVADAGVTLTTHDAQTIGSASDSDSASFAGVFADAVTTSYGADGAGSTTITGWTLSVRDADSGLSSDGHPVTLVKVGEDIVGQVSVGGVSSDIFRLSVSNAAGTEGSVMLTQYAELDHVGSGQDAQLALASGKVDLSASVVAVDADGDATPPQTLSTDLGGNIRFDDDVPVMTLGPVADAGVTLTTHGAQTSGAASDSDSASFAGVFADAVTTSYGADGAGSTTITGWTLSVHDADSGLSSGGHAITLLKVGDDIVGQVSVGGVSSDIFRLSVSNAAASGGTVTLTQYAELDHLAGSAQDAQAVLASGKVDLSASVVAVDGDGDATPPQTLSTDLGGKLRFDDDVPVARLRDPSTWGEDEVPPSRLLLDESPVDDPATPAFEGDGVHQASADFSLYFASGTPGHPNNEVAYGADGPGGVKYSLGLTLTSTAGVTDVDGVHSGLYTLDPTDISATENQHPDGIGQGQEILLFRNAAGEIEGRTDAASTDVYFTLRVNESTGVVEFERGPHNIWHPATGDVNSGLHDDAQYLSLDASAGGGYALVLRQTVSDGDGDTSQVSASLAGYGAVQGQQIFGIQDDGPTASPVTASSQVVQQVNTNLMLILDISDSMNDPAEYDNYSRLEVLKRSALELLDRYEAYGDVKVNIVTFASYADNPSGGWISVADAKELVTELTTPRSHFYTNYDGALNMAWNSYLDHQGGMLPGAQKVSYFMSDGVPNRNSIEDTGPQQAGLGYDSGIDASEQAGWEDFLTGNGIKSYALGMGDLTEADRGQLEPIAYDGTTRTDLPAIIVDNFANLTQSLLMTVHVSPLAGVLLDEHSAASTGTDGGLLHSITVGTATYDHLGVASGGTGAWDAGSHTWTIATPQGGTLTVDMDGNPATAHEQGVYLYTPPASIPAGGLVETFGYTVMDGDGDTASSTLTLVLDPAQGPTTVRNDFVMANGMEQVEIPHWALLGNDTGPQQSVQSVQGVSDPLGLTLDDSHAQVVQVTDAGMDGGSFSYVNSTHPGEQARVYLEQSGGGAEMHGNFLDNILIDDSGDHALYGADGNDILIGNGGADRLHGENGDDILVGGAGNDILDGGSGADVFRWNLADLGGTPATDHIADFTVDGAAQNRDTLDLRDLLTGEHGSSGVAFNLDQYLRFDESGPALALQVDHAGGGGASFAADQTIVFDNFADRQALATALGVSNDDMAILHKLIENGNLKTDP